MTTPVASASALPLFPLRTVLFPGGHLALQVFEVRYLDMVRTCLRQGTPFGVVSLLSGSEVRQAGAPEEAFHEVGTLAHIDQLESLQTGLLYLRCHGGQRFRTLASRRQANGLWMADISLLPDDRPGPIPDDLQDCAAGLANFLPPEHSAAGPQREDCGWVANRWCELLPLAPQVKQQLMALDNPLLRLELVHDFLSQSV